ncbi:hypothetical protein ACI3KS_01850 [Microbacterium sp. ZW T5_45]|uniref:hypothetical protein n=1 Tax=Microbacterium sp. ZW T5_45 TaxID=3378080 RepID=UPI003852EDE6
MTDTTGAEGAAEGQEPIEPVEGEEQQQEPPAEPQESVEPEKKGNAEAAKYRTQLRAAEATIADHESHIAELQEHVIVGLIADRVGDPKVFGKLVDREAWVGEDGRIDLTKLDAAVAQLLEDHPSLKPQRVQPRTKPQPGRGTPVQGRPAERPSKLERAFGDSGRRWSDVIPTRRGGGDPAVEAKSSKVRLEVSRNPDQ